MLTGSALKLFIRRWHRRLGLCIVVFAILLALTGVLLNHTNELDLDQRYLGTNMQGFLYGVASIKQATGYEINQQWITNVGNTLYFAGEQIGECEGALHGVLPYKQLLLLVCERELLLIDQYGGVLDRIGQVFDLPVPILQAGVSPQGKLIIETTATLFAVDPDEASWQVFDGRVDWVSAKVLPNDALQVLNGAFSGNEISWERCLLDLHSGRLFGSFGRYLMDIIALLMIVLSISGAYMWWIYARRYSKK